MPWYMNSENIPDLSGTYARYFMPEAYGAVGDGTTNDTTAVQAALDALPTTGGIVYLSKRYYCPGGLTVSKRTKITGAGAGNPVSFTAAAGITTDSTTVTALTVAANGCVLEDFAVINTATTPTSGCSGIKMTAGNGGDLSRVLVSGFYDNIEWAAGFYWGMTDCISLDPVRHGVWHHNVTPNGDWGDGSIKGGTYACLNKSRNPTGAAIKWESGGGLKVTGAKVNGGLQSDGVTAAGKFQFGIWASVADGVSTSVLAVTGCSVENCTAQNIRVDRAGTTGTFSKATITGNEIAIGATGIWTGTVAQGGVSDIIIIGNVLTDLTVGIACYNTTGVTIGPNHHVRVGTCVDIAGGSTGATIARQGIVGDNLLALFDETVTNTSHGPFGSTKAEMDREIPSTTSSVTYTALWNLQCGQNSAGIIDLTLAGFVVGVGNFCVQAKRAFQMATASVTLTTIGTDTAVGTVVDYSFDTVATAGWVLVKIRINAGAGGTDVAGRAALAVTGPMYKIRKGT